jgi:hypothetical protein
MCLPRSSAGCSQLASKNQITHISVGIGGQKSSQFRMDGREVCSEVCCSLSFLITEVAAAGAHRAPLPAQPSPKGSLSAHQPAHPSALIQSQPSPAQAG